MMDSSRPMIPAAWFVAALLVVAPTAMAQSSQPAQGQQSNQPPSLSELQNRVRAAFQAQDYDKAISNLQRMGQRLPFNGKLQYELAAAYALNGDKEKAFNALVRLQQQGLAYSPRDDKRFQSIEQYQLFDYVSEHLEKNQGPFEHAALAFETGGELKWPHAIARTGSDGAFFIGGIGQGSILRVSADGDARTFFQPDGDGPEGIAALAVDRERGHLWAAGTAVRVGDKGLSVNHQAAALHRFDLESGELEASFPVGDDKPVPHLFNEIAVGPDGRVFVADSMAPLIYVLDEGAEKLEAFMGASRLSGFHGLAVTADGRYLFLSDWVTGLYRIEVANREVRRLAHDPTVNLGGIHSLAYRDGELFAVQTGTKPQRVVRIQLSEGLDKAMAMFPLSANEAEYERPGLGVLAGDGYYFVANSGWSLRERPSDSAAPARVLKADPDLARDRKTPQEIRESSGQRMKMRMKQGTSGYEPPGTDAEELQGTDSDG